MRLIDSLEVYSKENNTRFHMPGHKGKLKNINLYGIDITEIADFDDLHNPTGKIKEIEGEIAKIYGFSQSKLLVNGSTLGILCAIFSMIEEGDKVLIPRNSHKSIYNALLLRKAHLIFLEKNIREKLEENPDLKLIIVTSPTYEGVVFNMKDIYYVLSTNKVPLLVDASHGAHCGVYGNKFSNPIMENAHLAVIGLHKTLPFLTQTSALLISKRGEEYANRISFYLDCFETSSPSYVLMGAADRGIKFLKNNGQELFVRHKKNLNFFYESVKELRNIRVNKKKNRDPSKIIIETSKEGIVIIRDLLEKYRVVPEMIMPEHILCLSTIMDEKLDFEKLLMCLKKADKIIPERKEITKKQSLPIPLRQFKMEEAISKSSELMNLMESPGHVSAGFIEMFPPGIPLLLPGELIENDIITLVKNAKENNTIIRGIKEGKIPVVKEWDD